MENKIFLRNFQESSTFRFYISDTVIDEREFTSAVLPGVYIDLIILPMEKRFLSSRLAIGVRSFDRAGKSESRDVRG